MARRRADNVLGFIALGIFAMCCGGPCAFIGRGPEPVAEHQQTPIVNPSVAPRAAAPLPTSTARQNPQPAYSPAPTAVPTTAIPSLPAERPEIVQAAIPPSSTTTASPTLASTSSQPSLREWRSVSGRFSTSASFREYVEGKARLAKDTGADVRVAIEQLSFVDRKYIRELLRTDPSAEVILGKVVGVTDGDTIVVVDEEKREHKIRLEAIDAPEDHQAFGTRSKQTLSSKIFGMYPWIEWKQRDKYGRKLGHVFLAGRHINLEMVAEGFAWHYKEYNSDVRFANAEFVARGKRLGLWAEGNSIPPWDFRHGKTSARSPSLTEAATTPSSFAGLKASNQPDTTVYVTHTGQKYHRPTCRHLNKSLVPILLSEARGKYGPCGTCKPPE